MKKQELQNRIKGFLHEWANCDNRGTRFPYYWTIADERITYEQDTNNEGNHVSHDCGIVKIVDVLQWAIDDGNLNISDYGYKSLDEIEDNIGGFEPNFIDDILEQYECTRLIEKEETYYEGIFFTEKDAEDYLEDTKNHHFGPNPRTYLNSTICWNRDSRTNQFLIDLFDYFEIENSHIER